MHLFSPNMRFRRCTSSSNIASPAPSTARLFGTYIPQHMVVVVLISYSSVRSREGRRNRAPPPRVRFNKDGKKINAQQAAKTAQA